MEKFLSVDEVSDILHLRKSYVYQLVHKKALPYFKPRGGKILFDATEIEAFIRAGRVPTDIELQKKADELLTGKQGAKR